MSRLDVVLVERGYVGSRSRAKQLIETGFVTVGGDVVIQPAANVPAGATIDVSLDGLPFVSRGGFKLDHGLSVFGVRPRGMRCVDLGASTGGFTDVLLQDGAAHVVAIDVGTDQLAPSLRDHERVTVMEQTDLRSFGPRGSFEPFDIVVADLSFISIASVVDSIAKLGHETTDYVLLVKPQFEVGRSGVNRRGIVRLSERRLGAVARVIASAADAGLQFAGCVASPIAGGSGNIEYLVRFRRDRALASWAIVDEDAPDE